MAKKATTGKPAGKRSGEPSEAGSKSNPAAPPIPSGRPSALLDTRIVYCGTKPTDQDSMFSDDWSPIQVKQMDRVGRPDIVAFGYSRDAHDECAAFFKRTGRTIKLLTVQEILDEEHVQKM